MDKVLVLSEDENTASFLGVALQGEHFSPILAANLDVALQSICMLDPDVLIVDVPFAGISPSELCMRLQLLKDKSMIVLGDSGEEIDKVIVLEAGADVYIVKPFGMRELVAQVRALLRRRKANLSRVFRFGDVEVDCQRRSVECHGQKVKITPREYNLLLFFLGNVDLALTRQTLLNSVWGYSDDANTRTLDVYVSKLRRKFETDSNTPRHFQTIHGVGYRFVM